MLKLRGKEWEIDEIQFVPLHIHEVGDE
jgi:hypothetical protein